MPTQTTKRLRACTICGRLTTTNRCDAHALPPRGRPHRRARAQTLQEETRCWICGHPARPDDPLTADHVIPRAHGGPNTRDNYRAAHASCNIRRGANT